MAPNGPSALLLLFSRGSHNGGDDNSSTNASASSGSSIPVNSPIAIGLFSAAGVILVVLIVWLIYVLLKPRRTRQRRDSEEDRGRPGLPEEWYQSSPSSAGGSHRTSEKSSSFYSSKTKTKGSDSPRLPTKPSPTRSRDLGSPKSYLFTTPAATAASKPRSPLGQHLSPSPQPHARALSRDEEQVLAHHTVTKTMPRPFAPYAASHAATNSTAGSRPPSFSFSRVLSHVRAQPFSIGSTIDLRGHASTSSLASSLSFASMPHRGSSALLRPPSAQPAAAVRRVNPGAHVVRTAFQPLLPDEIVVSVNDHVTVVDSYDDGWCAVCVTAADGDVRIGVVPCWVFEAHAPATRMERTSSLGVTVGGPAPPARAASPPGTPLGSRHSDMTSFSWSNF